jgi:hypothetical protein
VHLLLGVDEVAERVHLLASLVAYREVLRRLGQIAQHHKFPDVAFKQHTCALNEVALAQCRNVSCTSIGGCWYHVAIGSLP